MANKFLTPQNEKIMIAAGTGLAGYSILASSFPSLWQLPEMITKPFMGAVSLLTVSGAICIYGIWYLYTKF